MRILARITHGTVILHFFSHEARAGATFQRSNFFPHNCIRMNKHVVVHCFKKASSDFMHSSGIHMAHHICTVLSQLNRLVIRLFFRLVFISSFKVCMVFKQINLIIS